MAHHKRHGRRHWSSSCKLCKQYKVYGGNRRLRRTPKELGLRQALDQETIAWVRN